MLVFTQPSFDHGSACFLSNSLNNHSEFLLILSWHQVKTGNQNGTLSHCWWWWLLSWQVVQAIKVSDSQSQDTTSLSYRLLYDRRWSPKLGRLTNLFSTQENRKKMKTCTHFFIALGSLSYVHVFLGWHHQALKQFRATRRSDDFPWLTGHPN